jgi:hypothetical protein
MNHRFEETLRRRLGSGATVEQALFELRAASASIIDSINAVHRVCGHSLGEAKGVVHGSSAWKDMREHHDRFHDELERTLENSPPLSQGPTRGIP